MSRVSPHALFSRLVPTRRVLAIEHHPKEGLVALSHTDEYLAHAMSLSTVAEDSFVQVQQKLLTRIRLESDIGGVVVVDNEKKPTSALTPGIVGCLHDMQLLHASWGRIENLDLQNESIWETVEEAELQARRDELEKGGRALELHDVQDVPPAFRTTLSLARYVDEVCGGWANTFG